MNTNLHLNLRTTFNLPITKEYEPEIEKMENAIEKQPFKIGHCVDYNGPEPIDVEVAEYMGFTNTPENEQATVISLDPRFPKKVNVRFKDHITCWITSKYLTLFEPNGSATEGHETVFERKFKVGDAVNIGAAYTKKFGVITELSEKFPYKVSIELGFFGRYGCWISSHNLTKCHLYNPKVLYNGTDSIKERGFKIGDKIFHGLDCSTNVGVIVQLDPDFPHKAKVALGISGNKTAIWIKSKYILPLKDL